MKNKLLLDKMVFYQINKLIMKIYSNLSNISKQYCLKLRKPIMHRQFFKTLSENPENAQTHCNDRN